MATRAKHAVSYLRERWIKPVKHATCKPDRRLICFAHAGGSARSFRTWNKAFPDNVEIFAVQLPGREERAEERFLDSVGHAAAVLGEMVTPFVQTGTAFFGHSLGGLIAYETVRWLQEKKHINPMHLFVSACEAPTFCVGKNIHKESDAILIEEVIAQGGTPPEVFECPELSDAMLPVIRDDYRLRETYRYQQGERLLCPLTVCSGRSDASIDVSMLMQWESVAGVSIYWKSFAGGHFYLIDNLPLLARFVCEQLEICHEYSGSMLEPLSKVRC